MDKKKFLSLFLLGSLLILVYAVLSNAGITIPWIFSKIYTIAAPIIGGILIVFVLTIPSTAIEKRLLRYIPQKFESIVRAVSLLLSLVIIIACVIFIFSLVLPEFFNACSMLISSLRQFASDEEFWSRFELSSIPFLADLLGEIDESITTLAMLLESKINEYSQSILSFTLQSLTALIKGVASFLITVVFGCYFIMNKRMLFRHIKRTMIYFFGEERMEKMAHVVRIAALAFSRFVASQLLEALIIGLLCFAGMTLFRFPYAAAISALTGLTALIPVYGAIGGALVGAFIIAVSNPMKGLLFLIFIFVLQQAEGDLIYPRVVGTSTGIPSVYIFAVVTLGGALFGLWGMFFAVPVFAIFYTLLKEKVQLDDEPSTSPDKNAKSRRRAE